MTLPAIFSYIMAILWRFYVFKPVHRVRYGRGIPPGPNRGSIMGRISPEHLVQVELIERVRLELCVDFPELKGPNFKETGALRLFAVPNGGIRHIQEAVRLKAEGVQRGVPDLVLPIPRGKHCGAYLELKANKGRLSEEQKDWLRFLEAQGYAVEVAWTAKDAFQFLQDYLSQGNRARCPAPSANQSTKNRKEKAYV